MKAQTGNISLFVEVVKKMPDIIVCLSIPIQHINTRYMKALLNPQCMIDNDGDVKVSQKAVSSLSYALYEHIKDRLSAGPNELMKSKASLVDFSLTKDGLNIYCHTQGTGSALRKILSIMLSSLAPHSLYPRFSDNMKKLNGKLTADNKEYFELACSVMSKAIKKSIKLCAVGKINITQDKLKEVVETVAKKYVEPKDHSSKKTLEPADALSTDLTMIKTTDETQLVLSYEYLRATLKNASIEVNEAGLLIHADSKKVGPLFEKDKVKRFIQTKFARLIEQDVFLSLLAYHALSYRLIGAVSVEKLTKNKLSEADMVKLIIKSYPA